MKVSELSIRQRKILDIAIFRAKITGHDLQTYLNAQMLPSLEDLDIHNLPPMPKQIEMTTAAFKKKFKTEIAESAEILWREDKKDDYPSKAVVKEIAFRDVRDEHQEIRITD
jgi:hypothetical protein